MPCGCGWILAIPWYWAIFALFQMYPVSKGYLLSSRFLKRSPCYRTWPCKSVMFLLLAVPVLTFITGRKIVEFRICWEYSYYYYYYHCHYDYYFFFYFFYFYIFYYLLLLPLQSPILPPLVLITAAAIATTTTSSTFTSSTSSTTYYFYHYNHQYYYQ